jgi:MoxR-like ATPase
MGGGTRFQHLFYSIEIVNGDTQIKLMPFLVAIQTPDSIVVLDEIMSMDEDIALALNSILEKSQRYMNTPLGEIKVHPTCTIVATSNTNGREISDMYTGTKRQDESLIKRFVQYNMDYDLGIEDKIMGCLLDEEKDYISRNLKQLRYKIKEGQLSYDASTRQVCQTIELIAGGIDYKRAYWLAFMSPLSESERLQVGTPS